ncbi:exported hypothetical protein [Candidatus Accumulibacter aalborgensis]|uniref:Ice-binding protein C-terminal domain-containing protein n=1 Tax=Candidatus Accumulibacter aalborgensis TaxID=1860102 RepID=A0A1A8XPA9_9PROT|nr:PEP-CTERM sorting domain-containing protein [Candidatus Accumulibacter aalborgensis]SBT06476.1 exported hypothetical protein [Candidatus Accumulibacter aalborgensis]
MKQIVKMLAGVGLLVVGTMGAAIAAPASSCVLDALGNIQCDLYEEDANGDVSEIGWVISLPKSVTPGNVLILEPGGNIQDRNTWSDMLLFTNQTVQLVSDGCGTGNVGDLSCFGAPNEVIFEDAQGLAVWDVGNVYRVHSDGDVPEPATALLLSLGLGGLGWARRRKAA